MRCEKKVIKGGDVVSHTLQLPYHQSLNYSTLKMSASPSFDRVTNLAVSILTVSPNFKVLSVLSGTYFCPPAFIKKQTL